MLKLFMQMMTDIDKSDLLFFGKKHECEKINLRKNTVG